MSEQPATAADIAVALHEAMCVPFGNITHRSIPEGEWACYDVPVRLLAQGYRIEAAARDPRLQRCPVCDGHGRRLPMYPLPVIDPTVECHACHGKGYLAASPEPAEALSEDDWRTIIAVLDTEGFDLLAKRVARLQQQNEERR